ncbi:hypothetical protein RFI_14270 [Reticulomyxa filosa]|uniref:Uncharacterized protein n=1 Tax=Reticulomyxa filosa TaxID=46433 RepID=X6NAL4_RETFI|nr:hypothetical protein RFI_14270 [Reticulomyxa filosa]|eukprot:ETO22923.1 hypothetical protein RFI_14270 [Reticulomyxa filosa]
MLWAFLGGVGYNLFIDPTFFQKYQEMRTAAFFFDPNYKEYKEREGFQWKLYLSRWANQNKGNMIIPSVGLMSGSVFDKYLFGEQRFQQPPKYEAVCDEFIKLAEKKPSYLTVCWVQCVSNKTDEQSGVDPAKVPNRYFKQ